MEAPSSALEHQLAEKESSLSLLGADWDLQLIHLGLVFINSFYSTTPYSVLDPAPSDEENTSLNLSSVQG